MGDVHDMKKRFIALPRPTEGYHDKPYPSISPSRPELKLPGKTVLITGASEGIGFATANAFAEAGAAIVAITGRRDVRLKEAKAEIEAKYPETQVLTFQSSAADTQRMAQVVKELGTIDILVLNAALVAPPGPVIDYSIEQLNETWVTNVVGPVALIKAFLDLPARSPAEERTVIHTTSSAIQMPASPHVGLYVASKAAMTTLTHAIHQETLDKGVRIFSFHPAFAFTPGSRDVLGLKEEMGGFDSLDLPAHYAVWLCSSEADFMRGRYGWAHWDVDDLKARKDEILKDPYQLRIGIVQDFSTKVQRLWH